MKKTGNTDKHFPKKGNVTKGTKKKQERLRSIPLLEGKKIGEIRKKKGKPRKKKNRETRKKSGQNIILTVTALDSLLQLQGNIVIRTQYDI